MAKELCSSNELAEFLKGCELETKEGESFSLGFAISESCCEQLADWILESYDLTLNTKEKQ